MMKIARLLGTTLAVAAIPTSLASAAVQVAATGTTFTTPGTVSTQVVDLDGDGHLDIITGSTATGGTVTVHVGDGDGGFTTPAGLTDQTADKADFVTVADADEDGRLDLITADDAGGTVYIWHRLPGSTLAFESIPTTVTIALGPYFTNLYASGVRNHVGAVLVRDVTGDGAADLVMAGDQGLAIAPRVQGAYPAPQQIYPLVTRNALAGVFLLDMTPDAVDDLVVPSLWTGGWVFLTHNMTQPLTNGVNHVSNVHTGTPGDVVVTDLDADGDPDIVVGSRDATTTPVSAFRNARTTAPPAGPTVTLSAPTSAPDLATADLTGDGIDDIVAATSAGPVLIPVTGDSAMFGTPVALATDVSGDQIAVGDLDEDGLVDVVLGSSSGVQVRLNATPVTATLTADAFGGTLVGEHADRTMTVTNTGDTPLAPGAPTITGTDRTQVAVTATTCTATLPVGGTCTVDLRYTPTTHGALSASLTFPSAAPIPDAAPSLALSGTGEVAGFIDGPAGTDAGGVGVGATVSRTLTYTNVGDRALIPAAATVTGSTAWTITADTCTTSVAPAATCTITVAVTPGARGHQDATLQVGGITTDLTALGLLPGEMGGPASLDVHAVNVGASVTRTLYYLNIGDQALSSPAVSIDGSPAWTITADTCGTGVAASAECEVAVTAAPATAGTHTATLHVGGFTTTLRATGVAAPVTGDRDPVTPVPTTPTPAAPAPVTTPTPVTTPAPTASRPRIAATPRITYRGPLRKGTRLTATAIATGTPAPRLTYRWKRCTGTRCVVVGTGTRYTLTAADRGKRLMVTVTATSTAGTAGATSARTGTVRPR